MKTGSESEMVARYMQRATAAARSVGLTGVEMRECEESKDRNVALRKAHEAAAMLSLLPKGTVILALDERGQNMTSPGFADLVGKMRDNGTPALAMVVGGPDGLDPGFAAQAHARLAFGAMTWPHQLARIMAAEQIFRAITILSGHPYHRV